MRAWLEIDVERRALRLCASLFERDYFCMFAIFVGVESFADEISRCIGEHSPDHRIRRCLRAAHAG